MDGPSDAWLRVFPAPRIPDVLGYMHETWGWLQGTYGTAVAFSKSETALTDNLCEALSDRDRRASARMDCDFFAETRELRRNADGSTAYVARADIRVVLGNPFTPQLVVEFKKLNGSSDARRLYCFDGLNRFVDGKYGIGHHYGIMCGFACVDVADETDALAAYVEEPSRAKRLKCAHNAEGKVVTRPSLTDPIRARFETVHHRGTVDPKPITVLHVLLPCPAPSNADSGATSQPTAKIDIRKRGAIDKRKRRSRKHLK